MHKYLQILYPLVLSTCYNYIMTFSLIIVFILKSISCDVTIAILAFFGFHCIENILFHPFTFSLCVCFTSKVYLLQEAYTTLYPLIREFSLLTFEVIIDSVLITILLFVFWLFCSSSVPFFFPCSRPYDLMIFLQQHD